MEKKVMNTRLAVAAVVLLFGLLLAGQEAAAAGYDDLAGQATEKAAPATETATAAAGGYALATKAAPITEATPATEATTAAAGGYASATDAAEATPTTPTSSGKASYGKASYSKGDCEVPGTCDVKLGAAAAADPTRPGAVANPYTRGCSKSLGCRG